MTDCFAAIIQKRFRPFLGCFRCLGRTTASPGDNHPDPAVHPSPHPALSPANHLNKTSRWACPTPCFMTRQVLRRARPVPRVSSILPLLCWAGRSLWSVQDHAVHSPDHQQGHSTGQPAPEMEPGSATNFLCWCNVWATRAHADWLQPPKFRRETEKDKDGNESASIAGSSTTTSPAAPHKEEPLQPQTQPREPPHLLGPPR